ncbi:MAG TPA: CBS domain-containing protein [Usitatibacter sp.]|jgi:CBS-domain-containing membrane protein|nr:CBS domain-containing protein [Usitatibacter sp.]
MREYAALTHVRLTQGARVAQPPQPPRVTLDDPAFTVMTDFTVDAAATTYPDEPANRAHAMMVERGVRFLFVLDREGAIAGVITDTDFLGEKPLSVMQARNVPRSELRVVDLMTGAALLEAIPYSEVAQMRVGHVVSTLRAVGRKHLLVSENEGRVVRGIISARQVARQLGLAVETVEIAETFADVEAALVR